MAQIAFETCRPATPHLRRGTRRAEAAAMLMFTLIGPLVLLLAFEWRIYQRLLTPSDATLSGGEALLIACAVWSKSVLMFAPGLGAGLWLLRLRRVRAAWWTCVAWAVIIGSFTAFDLLIYDSYGRHLFYLMGFLGQPEAIQFVGGLTRWAPKPAACLAVASLAAGSLVWVLRSGSVRRSPLVELLGTRSGWAWTSTVAAMIVLAPLAAASYGDQALFERARAVFPLDPRRAESRFAPQPIEDTVIARFDARMRSLYEEQFAQLMRPVPPDASAVFDGRSAPNVVLIVLESLNFEEVTGGGMPRLAAWAKRGLSLDRHYCGSNHTEPGLFTLLYSRHPWAYHATLDARTPPQLCETFRGSGYEVGYFSGINPDWNRLDEFVNARTFERFEFIHGARDERSWPQWDRAALERLVQAAGEPRTRPLMALCFLNCAHMPYVFPPEYGDHPAGRLDPASLPQDDHAAARPEPLANYRRALAFLDDEIAGAIEALDPSRNIIIVTGDHGESIYHDGTHGHYTRHSEAQTRVPLFIVGPGVPVASIETATTHADVLPTLLHLLAGRSIPIRGSSGRDLLAGPAADEALVCCVRRDGYLELAAIRGQHRLAFDADSHSPALKVLGFQDPFGRPRTQHGQTVEDVEAWVDFLQRQIDAIAPRYDASAGDHP